MGSVFGAIKEETPKYEVLDTKTIDKMVIEIRKYNPIIEAFTVDDSKKENKSFYRLAKYYGVLSKPNNQAADKTQTKEEPEAIPMTAPVVMREPEAIPMTAPVVMREPEAIPMTAPVVLRDTESTKTGPREMAFILPSKYTMDTAPIPCDESVKLREIPSRTVAVYRYSGRMNWDIAKKNAASLKQALQQDNIKTEGEYEFYGYNSPFVLPMFRRNEVAFKVVYSN